MKYIKSIIHIPFLHNGQLLVELLIVIGIAAIIFPALLTGFVASRGGKAQQLQRLTAASILKETQEATRIVRESGWTTFATNGTFHPEISGSTWLLATGSATIDGFTRQVTLGDVYRDTSGTIVASGGILDLSTKKVVTTISWAQPFSSQVTATTYLTRFLENAAYTETTQDQFNYVGNTHPGVKSGVTVRATNPPLVSGDGEILLGAGGYSDWCTPTLLVPSLDLPGSGIAKGVTAIEGKAFTGTGENASGLSFIQVDITNTHPPVPSTAGTFDGYKSNDVFGETNYGYMTTDTNGKEVVIIGLPGFTEIGYYDVPGNSSGKYVYVLNNIGYVTAGNKLYNFDLSSRTGSRPALDATGVDLGGATSQVMVVGNYAYVAVNNSTRELQIVDISNPTDLVVVGWANLPGGPGIDVHVNSSGSRAYVTTASSAEAELYIVDVSTKTGTQSILGSYESNGMDPKGVTTVPGNKLILVGLEGEEYQVVDISTESAPTRCGGAELDNGALGVASVLESDGDAYSYVVNGKGDAEFNIVIGGPGGEYATSGVFESATFNPGYLTANNRLNATFGKPSGTELLFQVSMANLVDNDCPTTGAYTFVGYDGTPSSYYILTSGIPVTFPFGSYENYSNPGQCLRYKVYFSTTTAGNTPVLNDVTINYSP